MEKKVFEKKLRESTCGGGVGEWRRGRGRGSEGEGVRGRGREGGREGGGEGGRGRGREREIKLQGNVFKLEGRIMDQILAVKGLIKYPGDFFDTHMFEY